MIVIIKKTLLEFAAKHPHYASAINNWHNIAAKADWGKLADIKTDFNNVDYVNNDRYVFNIKGNDVRLVAMIFFNKRTLYIRFIGTQNDYNKIDCSTI